MLITIGAFDGFHKGHSELFRLCRELAGKEWAVVTFWPHPAEVLHTLRHTLFTLREKEILRRVLGIPSMYVIEFSDELRNLSPHEFWKLCRERFSVDGLVIGKDFHFGRGGEGNAEYLCELARADRINVVVADLKEKNMFSSSRVRAEIIAGRIEDAAEILGYPYFMIGNVIHGSQRGRTISYPTANIDVHDRIVPAYGVYACAVLVNGEWHCGALSIGNNPTFGDIIDARFEVNILDFNSNIYGEELAVVFLGRVREMISFPDKDALISQIRRDIDKCREIYENVLKQAEVQKFLSDFRKIYCTEKINKNPEIIRLV